jgi:hypothetical protein
MAITEAYSNTANISTTEFSLPNNSTTLTPLTVSGVYQIFLDTSAITFGDKFKILVKEKIISSGSQREIFNSIISGVMAASWVSPSLILMHGWDITITKLSGSDRSISWSIRKVS